MNRSIKDWPTSLWAAGLCTLLTIFLIESERFNMLLGYDTGLSLGGLVCVVSVACAVHLWFSAFASYRNRKTRAENVPVRERDCESAWPPPPQRPGAYDFATGHAMAEAIELNLERYHARRLDETQFDEDFCRLTPDLASGTRLRSHELKRAYDFADSFFDAANHGCDDVDHVPWPLAEKIMRRLVEHLRAGEEITGELFH